MDIQDIIRDMTDTTERVLSLNRRCLEFFAAEAAKKPESQRESGPEFVNLAGAAKYTTLSTDTISALAYKGQISVCKTCENGRRIFRVEDLRAYLLSIRRPTKEEADAARLEQADAILRKADNRREHRRRHTWKAG
jgi:hypothetical protein